MDNLSFKEIENLEILKRFQKDFYHLTGLVFDFVDINAHPSIQLQSFRRYTHFCRIINQTFAGKEACKKCSMNAVEKCLKIKKPIIYNCHINLVDIVVPLMIRSEILGVLASGQFLFSPPTDEKFEKIKPQIKEFGIDGKKAKKYFFEVPVIDESKARVIIDLFSIIMEYIIEMEDKIMKLKFMHQQEKINRALQFIETRYQEKFCLKDVAMAVSLSSSRLEHLFQEKLNTTFTAYLNNFRIEKAKFFLTNSSLMIIDICFQTGFRNLSHFNHIFKGKTGFSPLKYRKQQISTKI